MVSFTCLVDNIDKIMSKAANVEDLKEMKKLVVQANSFRVTVNNKKVLLTELDFTLEKLSNEISAI